MFSERRSAQVLSDFDLVLGKTLKRYKAAKITGLYRLKRFRGTNAALLGFCFRIERQLLGFCFRIERYAYGPAQFHLAAYSRSILFLMHVRNLYSSAETQGLAILLPRLSGIGRKPSSLSGGEARSCLGGETLQKQIPDFH